jgi:hypothetical protein
VSKLSAPDAQPLTARLAAAGSRRAELEALLAAAPLAACAKEYATLILEQNVAGKGSAVSRGKLLAQLRARYLLDPRIAEFVAFRACMDAASSADERGLLCYLMMARCDRFFREASLQLVASVRGDHLTPSSRGMRRKGNSEEPEIDASGFEARLGAYLAHHGITWSRETLEHARQHTLSSLKDFGVLGGSRQKRLRQPRPGAGVTLFAARLASIEGLTARQTLSCRWFRLLQLDADQAADRLLLAQRAGLLSFRMQAQVVELNLPPLESATELSMERP